MPRGPCNIRQHDVDVICKAARKHGCNWVKLVIDLDGKKITATASTMTTDTTIDDSVGNGRATENEWDKI